MSTPAPTSPVALAIDIGNTRAHFGIVDLHALEVLYYSECLSSQFYEFAEKIIQDLQQQPAVTAETPVIVASVIRKAQQAALELLPRLGFRNVQDIKAHRSLPVEFTYTNIEKLGADRIANCLYAHTAYPGQDSIVISAGTAITIDHLRNGHSFAGGAILPGPSTQFKSLSCSTDALPAVTAPAMPVLPGTSTESCIQAGVLYGIAGAIDRISRELMSGIPDTSCKIVGTGGAFQTIAPMLDISYEFVPHLTLIGTALYKAPSESGKSS